MKNIIIVLLVLSCGFLFVATHNFHQKTDEVISESNYKLQIIQYLIIIHEYKQALKLLEEWGIEYCYCVTWSESIIKIIGNKRYMWLKGNWHIVTDKLVMDYWKGDLNDEDILNQPILEEE